MVSIMRRTSPALSLEVDTLVHRLHKRALEQPEQVAYTFLGYGEAGNQSLTHRELDLRARAIGRYLRDKGASGKPVLLLFPSGLEYIEAYFGSLYGGSIAIPAYVPHSVRALPRIQAIVADAQADYVLTTTDVLTKIMSWTEKVPDLARLNWIAIDNIDVQEAEPWQVPPIDGSTLAFLQYTSGSTATPKGVMVSHGNLMHNLEMLHTSWGVDETPKPAGVFWLPIFHDMGLIAGILSPLYSGYPTYFMSPTDFLQRPLRWLQAISEYRGTFSSAPNFAYELCQSRISEQDMESLDLSCWESAACGAEPIRSSTLEGFAHYFSACGFPQTAFRPCYGLAEATLLVAAGGWKEPICVKTISKQRLEENYVEPAEEGEQAVHLVGCGRPISDQRVMIVDPETLQPCESSQVGEIWISGQSESVAQGYWRHPEETAQTFQAYMATGEGPFLRTGDLGVFQDGNLCITGRLKDLVIIGGRNLYPQDLELAVEQAHPAIRPGCCAAFSVEQEGEERLIILAEINHHYNSAENTSITDGLPQLDMQEIVKSVRRAIAQQYEVQTYKVLLLKIGGVLKTTSGKLQRRACRMAFLQGELKTWTN